MSQGQNPELTVGDDSVTPERESELIDGLLREQVGIDTAQLSPVVDLVAIGLANSAWRNSPVEAWHAGGRLSNGQMLRVNSSTTWRIRQLLAHWLAEAGFSLHTSTSDLNSIPAGDAEYLATQVYRWLASPRRKLLDGLTLGELARDGLPGYQRHAEQALGGFALMARDRGTRFAFMHAAAHGGMACTNWWGHPAWPALVSSFLQALNDPANEHWGPGGQYRQALPPEPARVTDRDALRRTLLTSPWDLDSGTAQWLTEAGIGHPVQAAGPVGGTR